MISRHPDSETLLRLADQDLTVEERSSVEAHALVCAECREQIEALEEALADYGRFHRDVLKPALPPPAEWAKLEFPRPPTAWQRPVRWLAAAAAIVAVAVLVRRFEAAPEVRAAELLRQAAAAEQAAPVSHARIRIRSGSRAVIRDARTAGAENADAAALHAVFDAAGYRWDDPLSVSAFSSWRDRQAQKQDQVVHDGDAWLVRTSSNSGALSEAVLTLRAADLRPVACTLRLRSGEDAIEMTELSVETPQASSTFAPRTTPSSSPIAPAPLAAAEATVGDELRVIAALHGIGADLGEPIEVRREGSRVLVEVTGLEEGRRNQIRAALAGIAAAQIDFEDLRGGAAAAPAPRKPSVSLADQLIDLTEQASERAYALRALARRFPPSAASQLLPADAGTLAAMLRDHAAMLTASMEQIRRLLGADLTGNPALPSAQWQTIAESLPDEVERFDRSLNGATDADNARKEQLAANIARIESMTQALQGR